MVGVTFFVVVAVFVERAEPEVVDVAVFVDEADVPDDLVELLVLLDVVVVVFVLSDDLATELRSCPALRTDTPFVAEAVRVTRCSND